MTNYKYALFFTLLCTWCTDAFSQQPYTPDPANYEITGGNVSEQTLRNYFKRAIDIHGLGGLNRPSPEDLCYESDYGQFQCWIEGFIPNAHPKFITGAAGLEYGAEWWYTIDTAGYTPSDPLGAPPMHLGCNWFDLCAASLAQIKSKDPQIICQANIGEIITANVNDSQIKIHIPSYVLTDLTSGLDPVSQDIDFYFRGHPSTYFFASEMGNLTSDSLQNKIDLTNPQSIAWVYYLGTKYIDAGYEALGLGELDLYFCEFDKAMGYRHANFLFQKLREYARTHTTPGRRFVLIGGDTPELAYVGTSNIFLLDYYITKMPVKETTINSEFGTDRTAGYLTYGDGLTPGQGFDGQGVDYEATIGTCDDQVTHYKGENALTGLVGAGFNPQFSWYTTANPFLIIFDYNGGPQMGFDTSHVPPYPTEYCTFPWKWDQATWFSQQSELYRNQFLNYAWHKVRCMNQAAYLCMPGRMPFTPRTSSVDAGMYNAYNASCTGSTRPGIHGFNQEETIKNIWNANDFSPLGTPPVTVGGQDIRSYNRWADAFVETNNTYITNADQVHLGDFDGDGKTDIIMTDNPTGATWSGIHLFLQKPGGNYDFNNPDLVGGWEGWGENFYIGDYDGDGKDDFIVVANKNLLGASAWNGYHLFLSACTPASPGTPATGAFTQVYGTSIPIPGWPSWGERFFVGDFNGDGNDDFVVMAEPRLGISWMGYKVYISSGGSAPTFTLTYSNSFPNAGERIFIGDFNGDGNDDIMATADRETNTTFLWGGYEIFHANVSVSGSTHTLVGFTQKAKGDWPSWGEDIITGDWNHDGLTDITAVALHQFGINWDGGKTYIANPEGNHFIYSFNTTELEESSSSSAIFALHEVHGKLYSIQTFGLIGGHTVVVEYSPQHCNDPFVTNSAKTGNNSPADGISLLQDHGIESQLSADAAVYPNPSRTGVFTISPSFRAVDIEIIDVNGRKVYESHDTGNTTIDLSTQANGIYMLIAKDHNKTIKQKLVIQR